MTFEEIETRGLATVKLYPTAMRLFRQLRDRAPGSYRTALLKTEIGTRAALISDRPDPLTPEWRLGYLLSEYGKVFVPEAYAENQEGFNLLADLRESAESSVELEAEHTDLAWYLIRLPVTFGPRYIPEGLPSEVRWCMTEQYGTYPTWLGPDYRQAGRKPNCPETVLLMLSTLAVAIMATKSLRERDAAVEIFDRQVHLRIQDGQFEPVVIDLRHVHDLAALVLRSFDGIAEAVVKDRDLPIWNALAPAG